MLARSLCYLFLYASLGYAGAAEMRETALIIPAGKNYSVPKGITSIYVDELTLEENASIVVPPYLKHFALNAKKSKFAKNTSIVAKGQDGRINEEGKNAVDLTLALGNAKVNGLTIISQGGNGGRGLPGSDSADGTDANCKTMRPGGDGVAGGNGSQGKNGGNGGTITVYLTKNPDPLHLNFQVQGGAGGPGGPGGKGGEGGEGQEKCGLWPYQKDLARGHKGKPGMAGPHGKHGESGSHTIQFD